MAKTPSRPLQDPPHAQISYPRVLSGHTQVPADPGYDHPPWLSTAVDQPGRPPGYVRTFLGGVDDILHAGCQTCMMCFSQTHLHTSTCSTSSLASFLTHYTFAHHGHSHDHEIKYPSGPARWQPWPPSSACAKAVTPGAGFLERQRLQFDMRAPLGRPSCFGNRTTVT